MIVHVSLCEQWAQGKLLFFFSFLFHVWQDKKLKADIHKTLSDLSIYFCIFYIIRNKLQNNKIIYIHYFGSLLYIYNFPFINNMCWWYGPWQNITRKYNQWHGIKSNLGDMIKTYIYYCQILILFSEIKVRKIKFNWYYQFCIFKC